MRLKLGSFFRRSSGQLAQPQAPRPKISRVDRELGPYRLEDGTYAFNLKVIKGVTNRFTGAFDQDAFGTECELGGFSPVQRGKAGLINVSSIASGAKMSLYLNYNIENPLIYIASRETSEVVDGNDKLLGLAEGEYTLFVVPEGVNARFLVRPLSEIPQGTCPLTQPAFTR